MKAEEELKKVETTITDPKEISSLFYGSVKT